VPTGLIVLVSGMMAEEQLSQISGLFSNISLPLVLLTLIIFTLLYLYASYRISLRIYDKKEF
jgi:hypothetical protein